MKTFWNYYGGKFKMARLFGPPQHDHVIEPFAGAANYSCYWEPQQVTLVEVNPIVAGIWQYLVRTPAAEIMAIPLDVEHIDDLIGWPQEARWLVGFHFNQGVVAPCASPSRWVRMGKCGWSDRVRLRIAQQVSRIRHWRVIHGSYERAPDTAAHWHVDPPYDNEAGRCYPFHDIDYPALGQWCRARRGFVQVCENQGADWLPFQKFMPIKATASKHRERGYSYEMIYQQGRERTGLFTSPDDSERSIGNGKRRHDQSGTGTDRGNWRKGREVPRPPEVPDGHAGGRRKTRQRRMEQLER